MKANYTDYMKLWKRLYTGVALTEERLSDNALNLFNYLRDGGAGKLMNRIGVGLRTMVREGGPVKAEFVYTSGENNGRALTIGEVERIGMLLLFYWNEIE